MKEEKRVVVAFDFDGTLTTKDTLLEFIKFSCGVKTFWIGFLLFSPLMVLMKLHLYPNWRCKQQFFSWFFCGMDYNQFKKYGEQFASEIQCVRKESTIEVLNNHLKEDACVYVVSASIDEWVRPFCFSLGVKDVLGTKVEVDSFGILTGRFLTKNCYGQEKVNRLLEVEPNRSDYYLYAYGDSLGDKEMLAFADKGILL